MDQSANHSEPLESFNPEPLEFTVGRRAHFFWAVFWGVVTTVLSAIGYLLSHPFAPTTSHFSWWTRAWGRSMFFFVGLRVRIHHAERIRDQAPCVIMANHQNALDIPATALVLPVAFGFVAKAELERVPFLGWTLRSSPSVFVDRRDPRRSLKSIDVAAGQIRDGSSVLVFPEGERSYDGQLSPFQRGAFILAVEAGRPIVPITIVNAVSVFDESRRLSRPGMIDIVVGNPISLEDMTRKDLPALMEATRSAVSAPLPDRWKRKEGKHQVAAPVSRA